VSHNRELLRIFEAKSEEITTGGNCMTTAFIIVPSTTQYNDGHIEETHGACSRYRKNDDNTEE
jgi:hypothetical protein